MFGSFSFSSRLAILVQEWAGAAEAAYLSRSYTAISAEQIVNELACGGGGRVHGAKCLAALAGVA